MTGYDTPNNLFLSHHDILSFLQTNLQFFHHCNIHSMHIRGLHHASFLINKVIPANKLLQQKSLKIPMTKSLHHDICGVFQG